MTKHRGKRLTAKAVEHAKHDPKKSKHSQRIGDPGSFGLALNIQPGGSKSWVQGLCVRGKRVWIGLGPYPAFSLADARERALANKRIAYDGGDPREARKESAAVPTFGALAEQVIRTASSGHKNGRSRRQWQASLGTYVYPRIGGKRVDAINLTDIMGVMMQADPDTGAPFWQDKPETARRVRQRMATVFTAAIDFGHRPDNPAAVALRQLPKQRASVTHHKALPWQDVPAAVQTVRNTGAHPATKMLFEIIVMTGARSGEARGARWREIDTEAAVWTVPAARMKMGQEHRVPLAPEALSLLGQARKLYGARPNSLVFPSPTRKEISNSTISKLIRENGIAAVPHGFRSSLRDFLSEQTDASRELKERILAHAIKSKVERAYSRSDLLEQRRPYMEQYAAFVTGGKPAPRGG